MSSLHDDARVIDNLIVARCGRAVFEKCAAMERAGWSERKIRRVMGENWLRLFSEVWGG
jgi:hypothetical protein